MKEGITMQSYEYTKPGEVFRDFCLWDYTPVAPPADKLASSNLLFHSFEATGTDPRVLELVRAIRNGIGSSNSVWGIKLVNGEIRWEFYFYDYQRRDRERSISRVLQAIRPIVACDIVPDELLHYFMFSIDISPELLRGDRKLDEIHMYIGNPGSTVSSGISYLLTEKCARMENFYFFFDAQREAGAIAAKLACSAFIDEKIDIGRIVWPEMRNCRIIVVANKQQNDAVYFSGINIDQFIFFLNRMGYPRQLVSFVEENRGLLDHLQYDVGFDYRLEEDNLTILKSGYYGIF
jgi:hypothetical protein